MGNQASTHNPELIDTSLDDWYGRGSSSRRYDANDDWAPSTRDPRSPKTPTALRSPKTSMYDEDVRDPVASTKPSNIFRPNLEPLVQATAAVFHMSSMDQYEENADWSLPARGADKDDVSISERSAAVFEHLEQQARKGNHKPFVKLLETATVVSQLLMGSNSEASEAEHPPVTSASSDSSDDSDDSDDDGSIDEEDSIDSEKSAVAGILKQLGSNDVIDVEKMNAGDVFDLLDKVSVEGNDVKEFSSAVFDMLEDAKSFSQQTPDERKVNIFRMLEENDIMSPRNSEAETRDDIPQERGGDNMDSAINGREDFPKVAGSQMNETIDNSDKNDASALGTTDVDTVDGKRSVQIKNMEGDPIDLAFVQDFDEAFNEFMGQNPKFLLKSPELVHNIRIAKLQKLLAFMNAKEKSVVAECNEFEEQKKKMEGEYQLRLREAARAKAARQIHFQSELDKISHVSNTLEAKFKWAVVSSAEARTKKHHMMRQDFAAEKPDENQGQVLARIPKDVPGQSVLAVIRDDGIPSTMTAAEKAVEIRKLQMNIAFLTSEVKMWQSKLEEMEGEKQKVAWVETILQQLSKKQLTRLRGRHQRKTGIQVE
mmetsp:Transcript_21005/g.51623  ORF Transcript_21005/g.51623 Transcript_21005/m.51623 type:complete len:598 (-) Transcript_21005:166-1959(-)|eukprot:CAMPEP_0113626502 /NCGR_PEP_ID=MMETSP0017_2-20120614/13706_1 /TAXON_ID=2856 /ORGANISM="Cylindrotheca closterium" /LENGTH=597 /DNA_ID=CAMNT_0000536685 /DNA_START=80 /DNA_END=1873 /DNA_ORIENTATION=+ /assembly_acc=CAM_ASM_000147